eukprot:1157595-Pelagomonas_calceolata.AAC.9
MHFKANDACLFESVMTQEDQATSAASSARKATAQVTDELYPKARGAAGQGEDDSHRRRVNRWRS